MLGLSFASHAQRVRRVLCLGAHCDDIEIGCGGTILRLLKENPTLDIDWVVFSSDDLRARETRAAAERFLGVASARKINIQRFRNGFFPYVGADIKTFFESLKNTGPPDIIFTHTRDDRHQDHRVVCELTWNTFRDHLILEYEIPKYDGGLGSPNFFVPLDKDLCQQKVDILLDSYTSQRDKQWFTPETFLGLARLRGIESNAPSGYAEAFYARKVVI